MRLKRLIGWILLVSVLLLGNISGATGRLNEGLLTNYMLFDLMFREAAGESELNDFAYMHVFPPMYSRGYWVRMYSFGGGAYMLVKTTSSESMGRVCAVEVVSDGEESRLYRELCAYAAAGLALEYSDEMSTLLSENAELNTVLDVLELNAKGYAFEEMGDGMVPYVSIKTTHPYEVEGYLDIQTDQGVKYPLPNDVLNVDKFIQRFSDVLVESYGISGDEIMHVDTSQVDGGVWLHTYLVMDSVAVCVATDEEAADSTIRQLYALDVAENPPMLVAMGMASFGAMAGFDDEQMAGMGLLAGAHTTFNDFLSFLPTAAYNDMMLVFGLTGGEMGTAYVMGTP